MGMGVAPDHDRRALGDPEIALAQRHAFALGEARPASQGPVHEPRVGRMRDRLGLDGGVHRHALEVLGRDRAGLVGDRKALLNERHELLLAKPLAPARQRGAVEGQLVAEAQLAAEELVIRVLDPARAQHLVREVVHVLQDEEPGHQPRRQGRLARPGVIYRAEAPAEKSPIDLLRQPHQRVPHVDDLIQRRPE